MTSCSSVPSASRKLPVAERAIAATASGGISIDSANSGARQHARDLLDRRAVEIEAVAAIDDSGRHLCASVVASTKTVCGGGSSSVFKKAFQAAWESMCASSRM